MTEQVPFQELSTEQLRAQEVAPLLKQCLGDIFDDETFFEKADPGDDVFMVVVDIGGIISNLDENQGRQEALSLLASLNLQSSDAGAMLLAYQNDPELYAMMQEKGYQIEQVMLDMDDDKSDLGIVVRELNKAESSGQEEAEQAVETKLVKMTNTCGFCNKAIVVEKEMPLSDAKIGTEKAKKGKPARKYRDWVLNVTCDCLVTKKDETQVHPEVQLWLREYLGEE